MADFQPIEVTVTSAPDFRPIEREFEPGEMAAPVAVTPKRKPDTGKKED